ncbi:MAG: tRNA pseudouridine(55) synthase TruB [Deferrisomatales bacterium]
MGGERGGLLVLDKPSGITSHSAVQRVRRALGVRKAGHAGTLDPLASGVLLVALGPATRLLEYLAAQDKAYRARIRLGERRDTLDREGRLEESCPVPPLTRSGVEAVLAGFRGTLLQVPPAFSAIKMGGERLYRKARRGEPVQPPPRQVEITRLELCRLAPPDLEIELECSKGTYVRSLARDLGRALGTEGCLWDLRRTRSGPFEDRQAVPLAAVVDEGAEAWGRVLPAEAMVRALPPVAVDAPAARRLAEGGAVPAPSPGTEGPVAVFAPEGSLVCIAGYRDGALHPRKVFRAPR